MRQRIIDSIIQRQFGRLVPNATRGLVAEAIVHQALPGSAWKPDWDGWDIEWRDCRIEVKQSARLQTWTLAHGGNLARPIFSCEARKGHWPDGATSYVEAEQPTRFAQVYVFAHHPVEDEGVCDHCDPCQWRFYVLSAATIPIAQKSIALSTVKKLGATECGFDGLSDAVTASMANEPKG